MIKKIITSTYAILAAGLCLMAQSVPFLSEYDVDDLVFNDNPVILFDKNDVFNNVTGYNYSAVRFRARGYQSESQEVLLSGIKMNDALTGLSLIHISEPTRPY